MRWRRLDRGCGLWNGASGRPAPRRLRPRTLPRLCVRRWHRAPLHAPDGRAGHPSLLPERHPLSGAVLMLLKVPVSWLREYVDITVPIDELALKVHMSSTEVKGIERPWWDDKIRTARVEKLAKHPNADKLQLATVDYGAGGSKTVVTGAT